MKNTKRVWQGKRFFHLALFLLLSAGLIAPVGFSKAKTITVDGDFSDWDNVDTLVDEADFTGSTTEFTAKGTTYYYNTDTGQWQTTDPNPGDYSCKVNYEYMVAVDFIKLTNDNNYLYMLWERGTDFMDYRWESPGIGDSGGHYYSYSGSPAPSTAPNNEFSVAPPCAGHVIAAPAAFDHDMVISVDNDKNGAYDYYFVINVQYPQNWSADGSGYNTTGYILQDDGNGAYDGISSETMKTTFGESGFEVGISAASYVGVRQEWRMSVDQIFTNLGISWDSSVNVRYEAHSLIPSDTSEAKSYTFARDKVIKLKVNNKKKTRKSWINLNGKTVRGATVRVIVNGVDLGTASVNKGGTFHKRISLNEGANTIRVEAGHATKGSNNATKTITRR